SRCEMDTSTDKMIVGSKILRQFVFSEFIQSVPRRKDRNRCDFDQSRIQKTGIVLRVYMIPARKPVRAATSESAISRRLRDLREVAAILKRSRLTPLETCRAVIDGRVLDLKSRVFFAGLPEEEKHYWISSLYALLMPEGRRR